MPMMAIRSSVATGGTAAGTGAGRRLPSAVSSAATPARSGCAKKSVLGTSPRSAASRTFSVTMSADDRPYCSSGTRGSSRSNGMPDTSA